MKRAASDFMLEGVEDLLVQIGSNIKTARMNRNMTISELANRVHVDEKTISRLESGKPSSNLKILFPFSLYLAWKTVCLVLRTHKMTKLEKHSLPKKFESALIINQRI